MERERKRRLWLIFVVVFLVLYPLSIGPVSWLSRITTPWLMFAYLPLDWVSNAFPPVRDLLLWYLRLWGKPM